MKKLLYPLIPTLATVPTAAFAHVKWFAPEEELHNEPSVSLIQAELTGFIVWIVAIIIAVSVAILLDRKLKPLPWVAQKAQEWKEPIIRIFRSIVGVWLIYNTFTGMVLAPNFIGGSALFDTLLWMQLVAGLLLLGNRLTTWIGSGILVVIYLGLVLQFGIVDMLDHIEVLGMAAFMILMAIPKDHTLVQHTEWGLPIMRVLTGTTLIILAFSEKLLQKDLALSFLVEHQWNFMQMVGFSNFSDALFILSAGMTELLFGIIFILGVVTRINTIALAVFFITTAIVLGPTEIVGHLPFFGMVLVYTFFGSGEKLTLSSVLARR